MGGVNFCGSLGYVIMCLPFAELFFVTIAFFLQKKCTASKFCITKQNKLKRKKSKLFISLFYFYYYLFFAVQNFFYRESKKNLEEGVKKRGRWGRGKILY